MSERKVLQKYYPPDFNPRELARKSRSGPKPTGPKVQTVRLAAPFSMRCTACGEYIYKGRRFNARKQIPQGERYLGIQIFFFSIKCTRCSGEIMFRTDPKNNDYSVVKGALRNLEPWRNRAEEEETTEQRLDRLEREEAEALEAEADANERGVDAMATLEAKNAEVSREMEAADALDAIRRRNARIQRAEKEGADFAAGVAREGDEERETLERELEEETKRAFAAAREREMLDMLGEEVIDEEMGDAGDASSLGTPGPEAGESEAGSSTSASASASVVSVKASTDMPPPPPPAFKRPAKKKKDHAALLGIKKKPSLV